MLRDAGNQRSWPISSIWLAFIALVVVVPGCRAKPAPSGAPSGVADANHRAVLHVAAAANLRFAMDAMATAFQQDHAQVQLELTYGSSGNFFAQLSQGAPFDIFFAADTSYPKRLVQQGLADKESYFPYALGRLVVWAPNESPLDLEQLGLRAVIDPSVKKIAIANPRLAPYGAAAESALKHLGILDQVQDRLVMGDNVTQAAHFVEVGAADLGILSLSLALAPPMVERGHYWEVSADAYSPIEQAAVILTSCGDRQAAQRLREFVTGPKGRKILSDYGYSPPKE